MNKPVPEQLDKILALADSTFDSEALVAVRKARQVLSQGGLSFGDLARAASSRHIQSKLSGAVAFLPGQREHLESQMHYMKQQIADLKSQMQTQDLQMDYWRRRVAELEQAALSAQGDAERWKKLARETAERLWDIGQSMKNEEFTSPVAAPETPPAVSRKKAKG